jgi:hypothetical protein
VFFKYCIFRSSINFPNRSTADHIFNIRQILDKKEEYSEAVHQLFIDFKKANDSVRKEILYNILTEFGIPMKLVRLMKMCLSETYSRIRVGKPEFTSCVARSLFQAAEGLGMRCAPRSVFRYSTCVAIVCHAAAVKLEPVRVDQAIRSEKGKDLIAIKVFKFRFQKKVTAESMERWCCTNEKCKCCVKCNASREIFGGDVRHNHNKDSEARLNRQILNNSVERKAVEDLCERPRKLIHKELHRQDLNTLNLSRHTERE